MGRHGDGLSSAAAVVTPDLTNHQVASWRETQRVVRVTAHCQGKKTLSG